MHTATFDLEIKIKLKEILMKNILFLYALACISLYVDCHNKTDNINTYEKVFTHIYTAHIWGTNNQGEGFSGGGSTIDNTQEYRRFLEHFMIDYKIKSVVDAGCGDWEFSRLINWQNIQYIGYDVVEHIIKKNIAQYKAPNITFIYESFLSANLPEADLFICKHVFQHLDNESILAFLPKLKKFKYCLITNEVYPSTLSSDNPDTKIGGGQKIDLSQPPFNITGTKVLNYRINGSMHQIFFINNTQE